MISMHSCDIWLKHDLFKSSKIGYSYRLEDMRNATLAVQITDDANKGCFCSVPNGYRTITLAASITILNATRPRTFSLRLLDTDTSIMMLHVDPELF
ncbi:hypothetical protein TNCV_3802971 [Trichonephila clavipes]|nr:hypothetical protein TNCV_3802971 [Trichonephila clavipes]